MHMASSGAAAGARLPVAAPARRWIIAAAKFGYFAKATVYAVIGLLALLAAIHNGKRTAGSREAFMTIVSQPFGRILLGVLTAGLAAYAFWRLMQALLDTDHHGSTVKGIFVRLGMAATGL